MSYERYREGKLEPTDYLVVLPVEPTAEDLASIRAKRTAGNSLAGSVAQQIVTSANRLMREEFILFNDLPEDIAAKYLFTFPSIEWDLYTKPAHVILNSEALLRTGETFQTPEDDAEVHRAISDRQLMADLLSRLAGSDIDVEAEATAIKADWQIKQERLLKQLLSQHPLRVLEVLIDQELQRFKYNDAEDIRSRDALQKGLERFSRLYTASQMMSDT